MYLCERIKQKRIELDLEQQELAKKVGISCPVMHYIEAGMRTPSVNVLIRIADALHCSVDWLLCRDDYIKKTG